MLCRNVFIYFSEQSIRRTVELFAARMPRPAYLAVGASESLLRISNLFELQEIGGAFIYTRPAAVPESRAVAAQQSGISSWTK